MVVEYVVEVRLDDFNLTFLQDKDFVGRSAFFDNDLSVRVGFVLQLIDQAYEFFGFPLLHVGDLAQESCVFLYSDRVGSFVKLVVNIGTYGSENTVSYTNYGATSSLFLLF